MSGTQNTQQIWFITGASRGFGLEFAEAALKRGDLVAATARDVSTLDSLTASYGDSVLPLALDVTDRAAVRAAVAATVERFGRLDIVVNNAGYGLMGAIEEASEQEIREQMEVNFFGAIWVTQEVVPLLREQGSGHIIQVTSVGGVGAFPLVGYYNASKWALEAASEALAGELAGFGVRVTIVEPGAFDTDWGKGSLQHATPAAPYEGLRSARAERSKTAAASSGSPQMAAAALLDVVDAPAPPLRVLFGSSTTAMVRNIYAERLKNWDDWEHLAVKAQG